MKNTILKLIESNSHLTPEDIAKQTGYEVADVCAAIAEMEADRVICGYNTIIDWDKIGDEKVNALIEVKAIPQRGFGFDKLANRIARFDEVDSVYLISGGYDFMVQIKGRSMKEVSQFVFDKLSTLENVNSTATHFVLKKFKDHGMMMEKKSDNRRENVIL